MDNLENTTITPDNPPQLHVLRNGNSTVFLSESGGGTIRALYLDGEVVIPMGPLITEDETSGQRGMMRYGSHNMLPPGGDNVIDGKIIRQHGVLQTISADEIQRKENIVYIKTRHLATQEFPFDFQIEQWIILEGDKLIRNFRLTNLSDKSISLPFGLHDFFAITREEGFTLDETIEKYSIIDDQTGRPIISLKNYKDAERDQVETVTMPNSVTLRKSGRDILKVSVFGKAFENLKSSFNIWSDTTTKRNREAMAQRVISDLESKYQTQFSEDQVQAIYAQLEKQAYVCIEPTTDGFSMFGDKTYVPDLINPNDFLEFSVIIEKL